MTATSTTDRHPPAPATRPRRADRNGADRAATPARLALEDVAKTFPDGTEALGDISFSVAPGELVSIVGPSGCGKSTILKLVSGLVGPSAGSIEVPDNLGYVFQDATLLPWRTVLANIELFAELHKIPAAERREKARAAISLVGLDGFEDHHPARLSGGMRMRVSLARSLVLEPRVFLFDEPFGALDEITRERLNDELQRLFVLQRFAGVFVTHSVSEAVYLADRVLVMSPRPGRIVAEIEVPFGHPRRPELRFSPEFAEVASVVSTALRGAHH